MAVATHASSWGAVAASTCEHDVPEVELEKVPCPGCGSHEFKPILSAGDHLTALGNEFAVVRCAGCDLVVTNPRPTLDSLGYFYPDDYSPYDPEEAHRFSRWQRLLEHSALRCQYGYPPQPVNIVTRLLNRVAMTKFKTRRKRHEWIPFRPNGKLLDVGCGGGVFMERMRDFGWDVSGLELAADVAGRVQSRTGIKVHVGTLPHSDLIAASFDAVTLWHVLEHVPNPRQTLKAAAELLRPNGLLVIELPNIDSWSFQEFGPNWYGLELPRHFQHFSPKTLSAMLPEGQFRNVEIQQIGTRSLIKLSAERAIASGITKYREWMDQGKSFFTQQAARTEADGRADVMRMVAERI